MGSLAGLGQGLSEWLATHSCFPEFRCSVSSLYSWRPPGTQDNLKAVVSRLQDWLDQYPPRWVGELGRCSIRGYFLGVRHSTSSLASLT